MLRVVENYREEMKEENERKLKAITDMHAERMKLGYDLLQVLQKMADK